MYECMDMCDYLCCGIANRQQCFSQKITTVSTQCHNGTKACKHNGIRRLTKYWVRRVLQLNCRGIQENSKVVKKKISETPCSARTERKSNGRSMHALQMSNVERTTKKKKNQLEVSSDVSRNELKKNVGKIVKFLRKKKSAVRNRQHSSISTRVVLTFP